ncbi:MAG TPA: IS701 family transposase [Desulfobacteraceae bacterium]|nr:IS701 family transposase [Desulfobacteraceae bacterium]
MRSSMTYTLESCVMNDEQLASFEPALARFLDKMRPCFKRDKTFGYLQKYMVGLMTDLKRKSIEPIALAGGVAVRTLQEFLAFFAWDHEQADQTLVRELVNRQHGQRSIGVLDASAHVKQGKQTPGVQRQWCGESGKRDNCVIGQHLLYTDNDVKNPFNSVVASDLYLPKSWDQDRDRCRRAGIPDELTHRPTWKIGIEQIERTLAQGLRFDYVTYDEEYGKVPEFIYALDRLGQKAIGEVPRNFRVWVKRPACKSNRAEHASHRVDNMVCHSPTFYGQSWRKMVIKDTTRGPCLWHIKSAQVYLVKHKDGKAHCPVPTDRTYWLIVAHNQQTGEKKYFISNAPAKEKLETLMEVAFSRWHVEKWFERAKQECGFGAFEVRTYTSLIRHWFASRLAMYFLADQTHRLRGEKSADHLGTSRRCGEYAGVEDLAKVSVFVETESVCV